MNGIFSIIAFVAAVIYFVSKHGETLSKPNKMQKIGVLLFYIITALIAGFCIYYGSSFLTKYFQNGFLISIIYVIVVIIIKLVNLPFIVNMII